MVLFEVGFPVEHQHTGAAADFSYFYGLVALRVRMTQFCSQPFTTLGVLT